MYMNDQQEILTLKLIPNPFSIPMNRRGHKQQQQKNRKTNFHFITIGFIMFDR